MWSAQIRHSPPCSRSTPWMRRTFEPMPSISAPSETRKRQRSCTCGSQAAFPMIVSPVARTAAMIAFSVPVTDASSRKSGTPRKPVGLHAEGPVRVHAGAELLERVDVDVEPATADHVAAGRRDDRLARAGEQRAGEEDRGADVAAELLVELRRRRLGRVDRARRRRRRRPTVTPRRTISSSIVATSRIAGTLRRTTGSAVSRQAATIGSAAFLLPVARIVPCERVTALDHERFGHRVGGRVMSERCIQEGGRLGPRPGGLSYSAPW